MEGAYVVGGGYKYCQLGPGNAFLRFPADTTLRPVVTGWFSEFTDLAKAPSGRVEYGPGPARFAGATYDFTSHYRGAAVFRFFEEQNLTVERLRELSQQQIALLVRGLEPAPDAPVAALGGFMSFSAPQAARLQEALRRQHIWADHRGDRLRLGPAPYVTERQLRAAIDAVRAAAARRG